VDLVRGLVPPADVDIAALFRDDDTWTAVVSVITPLLHADFQCSATLLGSSRSYGQGPDAFRAFWLDWTAPWATYRTEIEELTDLGDRVLNLGREFGRREGSTQDVQAFNAAIWSFRDGRVVGFDAYANRAEALKAAGVEG
jgi:ketosteroid isomerase-like protein